MKGLKKSKIKASFGLTFYEIPNNNRVMFAIDEDYITLVGLDDRDIWFRLGDREDLKPECLKDFGLTSTRSKNQKEREAFIDRVLETFKIK